MSQIQQIVKWMEDAGQTSDHFNEEQAQLYFGLCLEEMAEGARDQGESWLADMMQKASTEWRRGENELRGSCIELLDSAVDLIWVSVGLVASMGVDPEEALRRVIDSNESKRRPDGTLEVDDTGKVIKGLNYRKPDFSGLVKRGK